MMLWIVLAVVAFLAWYAVWGREWLKGKPWMQWLYKSAVGEWVETVLFKKSETILWARLKHVFALMLAILPWLGAFDVTPYLAIVPEKHRWWVMLIPSVALALDGVIGELQRNRTTKPVELVALPEVNIPPEVAAAVAVAEAAKVEAVAVVAEAKAEGAV